MLFINNALVIHPQSPYNGQKIDLIVENGRIKNIGKQLKCPADATKIEAEGAIITLGFMDIGAADYDGYLMLKKDEVEIHFFEFADLNPDENYGQVYIRTNAIDNLYQTLLDNKTRIHPNGLLELKPWRQKEFSILDPDKNLLTFGESY